MKVNHEMNIDSSPLISFHTEEIQFDWTNKYAYELDYWKNLEISSRKPTVNMSEY